MKLVDRLAKDEVVFTGWSGIPDALTVEVVAQQAFDAVTLDMQHGGHHEDSVLRSIAAIRMTGKHAIVRVPVGRFEMASRALDFGAEAVIAPMVNSHEDAQRFAGFMKYPPAGGRSWGPTFAAPRAGARDQAGWLADMNRQTISFAMIETRAALASLDDILAVEGVDGVFVGPADFSIAWSDGAVINPQLEDMMPTLSLIAARAREAGKFAGIYVASPGMAGRYAEMGYRLMAMGSEHRYIALGVEMMLAEARKALGK